MSTTSLTKLAEAFGDSSNGGHTYTVTLKHGQVPVTPENPGDPGQPINPDDPDGPKRPAGTAKSDLTKDATQTIHYTGAGKDTPKDSVTPHEGAFTKTVTVDKVTGEIVSQTDFTGDPYTFGTVDTPVVDGYHTEKPTAGGLTATVRQPRNPTDTVTYIANGQLIPVDQDGNPIPGTPTTTYTTDPKDPTKVVTEIPDVPGYTPTINGQPVTPGSYTPTDPSGDTRWFTSRTPA
ncbi:mucin-binding protein [Limosilactobacillus fermentum]